MTGSPDLTGRKVLLVEDDYYQAADTAAALRGAGAEVLGPCSNGETARDLLEGETPTHAVLDLNLGGGGPRFEIAHLLKARGVPFVFLTGYDQGVIPEELKDVERLQKPAEFRAVVEAISKLGRLDLSGATGPKQAWLIAFTDHDPDQDGGSTAARRIHR